MTAGIRDNYPATWRRSSRCSDVGNCVEVGRRPAGMVLRDSKSAAALPGLGDLSWVAFLAHCRAAEVRR